MRAYAFVHDKRIHLVTRLPSKPVLAIRYTLDNYNLQDWCITAPTAMRNRLSKKTREQVGASYYPTRMMLEQLRAFVIPYMHEMRLNNWQLRDIQAEIYRLKGAKLKIKTLIRWMMQARHRKHMGERV